MKSYKYYVYGYFNRKDLYAYIGVGQNDRVTSHIKENDASRKAEWLKKNEFKFRLLGRFKSREDAENAETMMIENCWKFPEICIPSGLLNIKRGHGGKDFFVKFDRLEEELNTGIDIDLLELKKEFIKNNRKVVVLNVRQSTSDDPYGDIDWIDYAKGYSRKEWKVLATEILIRCKGKIMAHYENVTWKTDGRGGHIPSGNKVMSSIYNGAVLSGNARNSQASCIYLYTPTRNHERYFEKQLEKQKNGI